MSMQPSSAGQATSHNLMLIEYALSHNSQHYIYITKFILPNIAKLKAPHQVPDIFQQASQYIAA